METELSAIKWCQTNGLLAKDKMSACNGLMAIRERNSETNKGFYFRCTVRSCRKEISVRKDTNFEGSHLSIATIVQFIYFWCRDSVKQDELQFQLEIGGSDTIVDWKNFCHDICLEYFLRNPAVIGGPGHTVEIYECLLVRRKYNVRHQVDEQWVFGGYDVVDKVGFMVPVDHCDAAMLLTVICQDIIISDLWAAYNNTLGTLDYHASYSQPHLQLCRPYNWRVYQPH